MSNKVLKPKKASLYQFTQKYSNNIDNCIEFFKSMKWSEGFSCDRCGCHKYYLVKRVGKTKTSYVLECSSCHKQHSLLSGTIFQSCKLDLYKLLLGVFLFFNENKGISAIELCSILDVNYKTALLLESNCRILMSLSNSDKRLNSLFFMRQMSLMVAQNPRIKRVVQVSSNLFWAFYLQIKRITIPGILS